jgi:hypothetical protein
VSQLVVVFVLVNNICNLMRYFQDFYIAIGPYYWVLLSSRCSAIIYSVLALAWYWSLKCLYKYVCFQVKYILFTKLSEVMLRENWVISHYKTSYTYFKHNLNYTYMNYYNIPIYQCTNIQDHQSTKHRYKVYMAPSTRK